MSTDNFKNQYVRLTLVYIITVDGESSEGIVCLFTQNSNSLIWELRDSLYLKSTKQPIP